MTDPGHHQSASGADPEADRAVDPRTSQHELHQLAAARPDLRPALAEHPNAYPGLLQWLGDLGDPAIDAALARRQQTSGPDTGAAAAPAGPSAFEETQ